MNQKLQAAMKRSHVPDCSAGPMSLAMEDRRTLAKEIERLEAELSWIYANCELRDGDNVHVDSDDVQAAVAAEAKGA